MTENKPIQGAVVARHHLLMAALDCGHSVNDESVTLCRVPGREGNALSQLGDRLRAALASAPVAPAQPVAAIPDLSMLKTYEPEVVIEESRGRLQATGAAMMQTEGGQWVRLRDIQALPAIPEAGQSVLTDEDIEDRLIAAGGRWQDGSYWIIEDADLHPFVRGIAAPTGREFVEGVVYACARMVESFDQPTMAINIIQQSGVDISMACPEDLEFITPHLATMSSSSAAEGGE